MLFSLSYKGEKNMKKNDKKIIILISIFLVLQTVIFIIAGQHKEYIHMDEAFSYRTCKL